MLFHEEAFTRIKSERSQKGRDFPILRVKNGSGSWIRTSDQVVNRSRFRTRKYLIQPEGPFLLTL